MYTNPPGSGLGTRGFFFYKHIYESTQLYLLHNEASSNTTYCLHNETNSNTQHIFFTMNRSLFTIYFSSRMFLIYLFIYLFIDKINVRSYISPIADTVWKRLYN